MTTIHVGLDEGFASVAEAEHWLYEVVRRLGLPDGHPVVACTHLVRTPWPHVAASVAGPAALLAGLPTPAPAWAESAEAACAAHAGGRSGRAVIYPGVDRLVGEVTVGALLAGTAIERIDVLDGPAPQPTTMVVTRDFVRPLWIDGALTLVATQVGDRIAPFEIPNPIACCVDHAPLESSVPTERPVRQ